MKKHGKIILAALLGLLILFSVSVSLPLPDRSSEKADETPPPASVSLLYRDAERILICTCLRTADPDAGRELAKFRVDEVLDGAVEKGLTFDIAADALLGGKYLIYLTRGGEEEDYRIMTGEPIPVEGGMAQFENAVCSIESIRRDIEEQRKILTVPSQSFFYGEFEPLVNACDEVIIGRVISVSGPVDTLCRSVEKGESTLSTLTQIFIRIRVENGFYGSFSYGDKIDVVFSPYNARPVVNATDLVPKTLEVHPDAEIQPGGRYIFFLQKSVDVKSDYYFAVNPYEGYVPVNGDAITHRYYNEAMSGVNDLKDFSARLYEALFPAEEPTEE